ncbi:hypothetical protein LVD15_07790 [Fulvivirga maritima]|uniref:tetratricopeptide repeat protein n=1 Tax=Fulvivirga maritima TaxID=2904247 RepID=UPI001F2E5967|nr:hypothetical protein [Fulvivirga maritima]UII28319.1 hypothetical protein LVD15_07790 [Fulvivirga maritima]
MAFKVPVSKQVSIPSLIFQFLLITGIYFVLKPLIIEYAFLITAIAYALIARILRSTIAKSHRKGISLVKKHQYEEAIQHFKESVKYFTEHKLIDKYRIITLLSASKMSYREMGLCNIAFCYSQIGEGAESKKYYESVLSEYPNNGIAIAGLRMLNSMHNAAEE